MYKLGILGLGEGIKTIAFIQAMDKSLRTGMQVRVDSMFQ